MGGLAGRVPYVGRPGGARGADGYGDQPGHRDLRMRRIASDEDYAYGAKADVFFELFGLGEKLKAWGKTKSVRAPLCVNVDVQNVDVWFTLPNKKECRGFGVVEFKESDSAKL